MDPEQWRRVKEVLDRVADEPAAARRGLAERMCAGDDELRDEVMGFLELDERVDDFIDDPLWRVLPEERDDGDAAQNGGRVGPYRIERRLGQGGMGEVFLAVREDDYAQKVALKRTLGPVLRNGLYERFVTERQILADLQHTGIARLLDGGTDEKGLPYLVMEYVEGVPIDAYCDDQGLSLRQRLRLVSKVCRIVHHAHQNLVVHRDLKPSNILVNAEGQPRLLDFGIAKLLRPDAKATAREMAVLTPACASPEQIMGEAVTTACDVYALGVLLYRLLAGRPPYELDGLAFPAIRRVVCLQEVGKPSAAVLGEPESDARHPDSAVIQRPEPELEPAEQTELGGERRRLSRRLRGDLDAIVLKAMRKEAEHRFGSAAEMADDIDRYLAGLPVEARRGNWLYYSGKHLRRNKPIVALLVLILALSVTSSVLGWQAEQARRTAVETRDESESLRIFLVDILRSPAPDEAKGRERTVREVIEEARPNIDRQLAGRPNLQAEMLGILGDVFHQLGDPERALELYLEALARQREHSPEPNAALADDIANVGSAYYGLRDYKRAERAYQEALAMHENLGNAASTALTLYNLSNVRMRQGKTEGIEQAFERVLEMRRQLDAPDGTIADSLYSLGTWRLRSGRFADALPCLEEALQLRRAAGDDVATGVAAVGKTLARAYHAVGRLAEARELYDEALATQTFLLGEDHPKVLRLKLPVARLLLDSGELGPAGELVEQTLDQALVTWPQDHPEITVARSVEGAYHRRLGHGGATGDAIQRGYAALLASHGTRAFVTRWTRRQLEEPPGPAAVPGR